MRSFTIIAIAFLLLGSTSFAFAQTRHKENPVTFVWKPVRGTDTYVVKSTVPWNFLGTGIPDILKELRKSPFIDSADFNEQIDRTKIVIRKVASAGLSDCDWTLLVEDIVKTKVNDRRISWRGERNFCEKNRKVDYMVANSR